MKNVVYNLLKEVLWIKMISWNNLNESWKKTWHVQRRLWILQVRTKTNRLHQPKVKLHYRKWIKNNIQEMVKFLPAKRKKKKRTHRKPMIYGASYHIDMIR